MSGKSFSYGDVLGFGWSVMKANFWFFVGLGIVIFLLSLFGQIVGGVMENNTMVLSPFLVLPLFLASFIIQTIVAIGLIRIALSFCDGIKPGLGTLFNGWDCFLSYLGTGILYTLIIGGTSVACILPFVLLVGVTGAPYLAVPVFAVVFMLLVILSIKFSLSFYFVVDKSLGPIKALKASSLATAGAKGAIFLFLTLCGMINFLGILCFGVGIFATFPTVMVAMALVYRQLSEQTPELVELGIGGPDTEPRTGAASGVQPAAGMQPSPAIQSGLGIRLGQGVQLNQDVQHMQGVQPNKNIQPSPAIQNEEEKKSDNSLIFWLVALVILSVVLAASIGYRFWPRAEDKIVVSLKDVEVASKEVSLKGILYSEDNPSALIGETVVAEGDIIDGVKVVKIHRDTVEFEKDGERWTQRAE